ncbi:MAG: LPXTG cell wall anchor domain-containing protein, partial [Actinomycetota bacterium]|nr:LPXTG cell wall anchor domain-containing protein [Actinomycetota bacterium]
AGTGTNDGTTGGNGKDDGAAAGGATGIAVLPAGSLTADAATAVGAQNAGNTAVAAGQATGGKQQLANTGADTGLLPLALALLVIGGLMAVRRKKA